MPGFRRHGRLFHLGVKLGIYPPLIFLGTGTMTDFEAGRPPVQPTVRSAAAQLGIFFTFVGAKILGFTNQEAGAIGIIGGADGPTAIYVTTKLAPHLCALFADRIVYGAGGTGSPIPELTTEKRVRSS